jgi:hypothetical protein
VQSAAWLRQVKLAKKLHQLHAVQASVFVIGRMLVNHQMQNSLDIL